MDALTTDDSITEDQKLELASKLATVNLLFVQQELGRRAVDPTTTTRQLLDIGEHSYKVSGMAKKQEPENHDNKFVYVINMGDTKLVYENGLVLEQKNDGYTPAQLVEEAQEIIECPEFKS